MKYCLIGEKLSHSYSKTIHELFGLDYSLVELNHSELEGFFKNCEYSGFNVTIPYKKEVLPYLKTLSKEALTAGAVNTVVNKNGEFYGYNTDIEGMNYMLKRRGVTIEGKNVLILGSGGTANTAISLCKLKNAKSYTVVSRKGEVNYQNCYDLIDTQIIINTTPVGMYPNVYDKPIELGKFTKLEGVFDCIYNPKNTELLSEAKRLNIPCSGGLAMLVKQGMLSEDIWLNKTHTDSLVEEVIKKISLKTSNIVLMGMPSSGKSTIGKMLAKTLGLNFIDTDEEITKRYNKSPSQIILSSGEKAFREIETQVVKDVSLYSGYVISLGGGAVLNPENVKNLKRNGTIVYIKRDLELLSSKGRPLSQSKGVYELYNERKGVYESAMDFSVENNSTIENCVKEIVCKYETITY